MNLITFDHICLWDFWGDPIWLLSSALGQWKHLSTPLSGWIFHNALEVRIESFLKELMAFLHIPHNYKPDTPILWSQSYVIPSPALLIRPFQIFRHPIFITLAEHLFNASEEPPLGSYGVKLLGLWNENLKWTTPFKCKNNKTTCEFRWSSVETNHQQ